MSYDPKCPVPELGSEWIWEPKLPRARVKIEVVKVLWNGEEWWVQTIDRDRREPRWNDMGRFWEACVKGKGYNQDAGRDLSEHAISGIEWCESKFI